MRKAQPRPPKIPRPKVKELRKLYKALNTPSITLRIEAMKVVLQWYDQALPYVESKVANDLDRAKLKERMLTTRRFELIKDASIEKTNEAENGFRRAVILTETYCKILRPYSFEKVYAIYEKLRTRARAKQERMEQKFKNILSVLRILQPTMWNGESMRITIADMKPDRKLGFVMQEFLYNRAQLKRCQLVLRKKGMLPLLIEELRLISRASATSININGHFFCDHALRVEKMFKMLGDVISYCGSSEAPRRLVRFGVNAANRDAETGSPAKVPYNRSQSRGKAFGKRVLVDNLYAEGSATAILHSALKEKQGAWIPLEELQGMISTDITTRLRVLKEKAPLGGWAVHVDKTLGVRMTKEEAAS